MPNQGMRHLDILTPMNSDFDAWWELRGCREEYGNQEAAARAAWEAAKEKYRAEEERISNFRKDQDLGRVNWLTGQPYSR